MKTLSRYVQTFLLVPFLMGCGAGSGSTPQNRLVAAARNDDVTTLAKLLNQGANINGQESGMLQQIPLIACSAMDGTNAFYFLLAQGADVNAVGNNGTTALMEAITLGDQNLFRIKELIRRGARVDAIDKHGNSVLKCARAARCQQVVQELIDAGAKE